MLWNEAASQGSHLGHPLAAIDPIRIHHDRLPMSNNAKMPTIWLHRRGSPSVCRAQDVWRLFNGAVWFCGSLRLICPTGLECRDYSFPGSSGGNRADGSSPCGCPASGRKLPDEQRKRAGGSAIKRSAVALIGLEHRDLILNH